MRPEAGQTQARMDFDSYHQSFNAPQTALVERPDVPTSTARQNFAPRFGVSDKGSDAERGVSFSSSSDS
jgi:hypothetical protein